jgi:hypothetical protein
MNPHPPQIYPTQQMAVKTVDPEITLRARMLAILMISVPEHFGHLPVCFMPCLSKFNRC